MKRGGRQKKVQGKGRTEESNIVKGGKGLEADA